MTFEYLENLIKQASVEGRLDLTHYTNLILLEAARAVKDTKITGAYTTFDAGVAETQRAECFRSVYNLIVKNIENATS